jgi:hypothetical protein
MCHISLQSSSACHRDVLLFVFTRFYCQDIRAYDILFGDVPQPAQAEDLYEILNSFTEKYETEGQRINLKKVAREQRKVLWPGFTSLSVNMRGSVLAQL